MDNKLVGEDIVFDVLVNRAKRKTVFKSLTLLVPWLLKQYWVFTIAIFA